MTIEQVKEEAKKRFDKDLTDEQARAFLEAHPAGELQDEELADVAGGGCGDDGPKKRVPRDYYCRAFEPNPNTEGWKRLCRDCRYGVREVFMEQYCTRPGGPVD